MKKSRKSAKKETESKEPTQMFADEKRQEEIIAAAQQSIEENNFLMNRALDRGDLEEAFTWAAKLIVPLFTWELTPRNYYTVYHLVSTSLLELSIVISDKMRISDKFICEQYEMVQYHSHALQRLYLMIVLGPELSKRTTVKIVDVMDDLTDMLRQAQDPIRALFLRHFLLSVFKQNLPEENSRDLEKTLSFLLNNFSQMNRLWVRIAGIMAQDNRKSERAELSVLIGMNIQRISSLHGLSADTYSQMVLPYIAKHVELCEDEMAQEFILQSIVHAFPEEYHMATIDILFGMFGRVEQGVKILTIVNQLLERLVGYVGTSVDEAHGHQIFVTVAKNIEELFSSEGHLALTDKFETLEKLVRFALKINPEDVKNVRNLMKFTDFHIDLAIGEEPLTEATASQKLRTLIECPLAVFKSGESLFQLEYLPVLIKRLMLEDRRAVAQAVCQVFVDSSSTIGSLEELQFVLSVTSPLVREGTAKSCFYALFHLIDGGSVSATMGLLQELASAMETTTEEAANATILPVGLIAVRLMSQIDEDEEDDDLLRKLIQFVALYGKKAAETNVKSAIMVFAEASKMLDTLEKADESAELAEMAVTLWDELEDPQLKFRMYNYIMQFVLSSRFVDLSVNAKLGNFASTITDTSKAVIALTNCAALFWREDGRIQEDGKVHACLAKATKAAVSESSPSGVLSCLYQVLGATSWAFDKGIELDQRWVRALIDLISDKHEEIKAKGASLDAVLTPQMKAFYVNTARYIQSHNWVREEEDEDEEEDEEEESVE